jgi:hypothetical protein
MNIKNNIIKKLMIIILMLLANIATAATGWLFAGQCLATNNEIQSAIEAMYPIQRELLDTVPTSPSASFYFTYPTNLVFTNSGVNKLVTFKFEVVNRAGVISQVTSNSLFTYTLFPCDLHSLTDSGTPSGSSDIDSALLQIITNLQETQATNAATLASIQQAQQEPFDIAVAWAAFSFFFSGVLLLWVVAKSGGMVLAVIRKG